MKIAVLNDTHWGARNDSPAFVNYFNRFYDEIFFPYLQENNIKTVIHLGDVVDRRKFINFQVAHNFQKKFWKRLWDLKIDTHIIIGNHDTYYKNTNEVNAMEQLITTFDGINEPWIYTKPKTVNSSKKAKRGSYLYEFYQTYDSTEEAVIVIETNASWWLKLKRKNQMDV